MEKRLIDSDEVDYMGELMNMEMEDIDWMAEKQREINRAKARRVALLLLQIANLEECPPF